MKCGGLKKLLAIVVVAIPILATIVSYSAPSTPVYAVPGDQIAAEDKSTDQCEAQLFGFGWILCPGQNLVTTVIGWAMGLIDNMMNWTMLADHPDTLQDIWSDFLSIANIVFAITFIVMIYSMATSTGLSNYDLKKVLPRLIIVAIAVNLSFYLCAALVDFSNIAGKGVYSLITSRMDGAGFQNLAANVVASAFGVAIAAVAIVVLGGTIIVAILAVLIAITFRNLALVVLVAISPIAMALYTLPNTEQWGKKWLDTFVKMLLVYPAFTAVWGAAQLVSWITANVGGGVPFIVDVVCAIAPAIAILPIFKATGGLMGLVAGGFRGSKAIQGLEKSGNNFTRASQPAINARRRAGRIAMLAQNSPALSNTPVIGAILRKPGYNKLVTNAANFEAGLDKEAMTGATNWAKGLSKAQLKSVATTGTYEEVKTDKDGNKTTHTQRVADTYQLRAAVEASKDSLSGEDWGAALRSMNARAIALRNAKRNGEADALMKSTVDTAVASKNAIVGNGWLNKLADGDVGMTKVNGKYQSTFDRDYNLSMAKSAGGLSQEKYSKLSADNAQYIAKTIQTGMQAGGLSAEDRETYDKALANLRNTSKQVLENPKMKSGMNSKAQDTARDMDYLETPIQTAARKKWNIDAIYDMWNNGDPRVQIKAAPEARRVMAVIDKNPQANRQFVSPGRLRDLKDIANSPNGRGNQPPKVIAEWTWKQDDKA